MKKANRKVCSGVSLVELIVTMAISSILILTIGALLAGGQRSWQQIYDKSNSQIKRDAQATMVTFGITGRKSNRLNYTLYKINHGTFTPALPQTSAPEEVVSGDAVEFRYWDVELGTDDSHNLLDTTKTATAYALFYVDSNELKVDYGLYPPGGVHSGGGFRNTSGITTTVLANNVSTDPQIGAFSHTTINGKGQGCVRINITLTDESDKESIQVMTSTMMRNVWPK